jgi:hypothetical protein
MLDLVRTKEAGRVVGEASLAAIDEGIAADQYGALKQLATLADFAAARAANTLFSAQIKEKSAQVDELLREWPAAQAALEKLNADPKSPAANLTAGKFFFFLKGDLERGLPLLAKGSDVALQKLAAREQADPAINGEQLFLADVWFDLSEKEKSKLSKRTMLIRAAYWYAKAQPDLTGLNKARVDKRLEQIEAVVGPQLKVNADVSGKWVVTWPTHPEYGKRTCEFAREGINKIGPRENFGAYIPVKWSFKSNQVVIQYKNGEASRFAITDDNTLTQTDGGDALYTREAKP